MGEAAAAVASRKLNGEAASGKDVVVPEYRYKQQRRLATKYRQDPRNFRNQTPWEFYIPYDEQSSTAAAPSLLAAHSCSCYWSCGSQVEGKRVFPKQAATAQG